MSSIVLRCFEAITMIVTDQFLPTNSLIVDTRIKDQVFMHPSRYQVAQPLNL